MAKKKGFSIVKVLLNLVIIVVVGFAVYNYVKNSTPPGPPVPTVEKLDTPTGVEFDENNYTLSWNDVDNAMGYVISYNGTNYNVEFNSRYFLPTAEENEFKVKAVGDNIDYSDSDWSAPITYTMTQSEENVFDNVNLQLAQTASENDLTLVDVIGISYASTETGLSSENLRFETICSDDGVNKNISMAYTFEGYESVSEMLQNFDSYTDSSIGTYDIVNYNSAEKFLLSNSFDGNMEVLRQQGYEFSVVDSCVREGSKSGSGFRFSIVGTYKAEKDGDVKYFTSVNGIYIPNPSGNEKYNYEDYVMMDDRRTVTESYFVEHTNGTTNEYMEELIGSGNNVQV